MAISFSNILTKCCLRNLEDKFLHLNISCSTQIREQHFYRFRPRLRNPTWLVKKNITVFREEITPENAKFLKEVVQDQQNAQQLIKNTPISNHIEWSPKLQRTGVIARKIGIYPMWYKDGKKTTATLLQILDNHVVRSYSAEEYEPPRKRPGTIYHKKACLIVGAEAADPTTLSREYCGLFKESGVIPKKHLGRFFISPDAALPLGTMINSKHFQVGNYVDVRGKTIDRGFQGVMKRHGFKGMPASHGATKTHRRGGNIGGGGEKGRVWPGTKMPGHMGNRYRVAKGLKILRINSKHDVLWVSGQAIPGETNSICYIFDTKLPLRKPTKPLPFPTFFETDEEYPEDIYDESIHSFSEPTILYDEDK